MTTHSLASRHYQCDKTPQLNGHVHSSASATDTYSILTTTGNIQPTGHHFVYIPSIPVTQPNSPIPLFGLYTLYSRTMAITAVHTRPQARAKMPSASPLITATALLAATPHEKAMLQDIYELLNKLFARNRNQHRRSHWWKSLHAFRKQIGVLLQEMEGKRSERESKLVARLRYWDEKCIHQWY